MDWWIRELGEPWHGACSPGSLLKTARIPTAFGMLWLLASAVGIWILLRYENAPGRNCAAPERWPTEARINVPQGRYLLLMFAHPKCPCTRASIDELNRLLAHCDGKVVAMVLFAHHGGMAVDWASGSSSRNRAASPGVSVPADLGGSETRPVQAG